jgi:hypothetical protein
MARLDEPVDAITIALRVGRAIESAEGAYFLPARADEGRSLRSRSNAIR